MKKHSLKIIKIPSPKSPIYRQEFIPQPINYLKIIENPDKIKVDQLTRDYDPQKDLKLLDKKKLVYPNPEPFIPPPSEIVNNNSKSLHTQNMSTPQPPKPINSNIINNISKYKFDIPPDSDDEDFDVESRFKRYVHSQSVEQPIISTLPSPPIQQQDIPLLEQYTPPPIQYTPPPIQYTPPPIQSSSQYTPPPIQSSSQYTPPPIHQYTPPPNQSSPQYTPQGTHERLHDFLKYSDSDSDNESATSYIYRPKKKNMIDPLQYMSKNQRDFTTQSYEPPTLEELKKVGEYKAQPIFLQAQQLDELEHLSTSPYLPQNDVYQEIKNENDNEDDDSIDDKKREILMKLDLLRKKYPVNAKTIPELNMQTSYNEMKSIYIFELKKLEMDSNVANYRQYLMGGFMLIEYILGRYLRIDLEGFTQQQIINMQQYEILLIEMGEKNYVPDSKKWSVELRLLSLIFIQATLFTVSKLITQKTGNNLLNMFNDALPQQQSSKKKVKRPDIDIDDL